MTKKKENQLGTTWFGTRKRPAQAPSPPFAIVVPVASAAKDDFAVGSPPQTHRVRTLGRNGRPVCGLLHLVREPTAWYGTTSLFLAIVLGGCSTVHYSPTLGQNSVVTPLRDEQVLKGQPRFSLAHKAEYSVSMGGSESFLGTYGAVLYDQSFSIADSVSYSIGMDGGAYLVAAKDRSVPPRKFDQYSWGPSLGLQQGVAWSVDGVNCSLGTDLHYERESGPLFEARGRLIPYLEKGTWEGQDSNKSPI